MSPSPRGNSHFLGHEKTEQSLLAAIASGRLPHGIIFSGESGIGKATLAFRLARHLLTPAFERLPDSLTINASSALFNRVTAGSHGDLIVIDRQHDTIIGKQSKEIAVEDIRKIAPFLRMTAAEGGWRVAIIDEASTLNRAGQNALLKILEEPPPRTLIVLLADRPGALLPTIHSRSRMIKMDTLSTNMVVELLERYAPELDVSKRIAIAELAGGSIGKALRLIESDGFSLYSQIVDLLETMPHPDWQKIHSFADQVGGVAAESSYRLFAEFMPGWLGQLVSSGLTGVAPDIVTGEGGIRNRLLGLTTLDRWLDACEKITQRLTLTDTANLDRRLAVWAAFEIAAQAAH